MKIEITTSGEEDVGISPVTSTVELGLNLESKEEREEIRELLRNCFHEIHDCGISTSVIFEDEMMR